METNQHQDPAPEQVQAQGFFQSTTAKIIMVGVLTLLLLIPLQYVKSLIYERSQLQEQVSKEITNKVGGSVYFYGPVLKIPYRTVKEIPYNDTVSGKAGYRTTTTTEYAYFFPNELKAHANVQTEPKYRNNYESAVFNAKMNFEGNYISPDFTKQSIAPENIIWDKASIIIRTNNIKSIKGSVSITLNGKDHAFEPIAKEDEQDSITTLETPAINIKDAFAGTLPFTMDVDYGGSEHLSIVPIGKLTEATMASNWHTPKFDGNFLPEKKSVTDKGFQASWRVSHLNRPFVQQYFENLPDLAKYSFDVGFLIPVDEYQKNERASKYGFLVIGLTFLIFFLIQMISKISIHIFQYTMIGLALIMFYTLLISITEHSSFRFAYIIAGVSVVVMITLYSVSILKNLKFPMLIAGSLTGLYAFIYVIIQLESYALLAGSIGLFLILGAVMYFSRRIDWNAPAAITR